MTFPQDLLSGWRHGRSLRSLPDVLALKTADFLNGFNKKPIPFQSRPLLAARSRTPRHSKPLMFLLILIRNRYFSVPAAPGRSLPDAPSLKTVDFLNDFNKKSILFQSRPLLAARSWTPRLSKPLVFLLILIRNRYFFSPGRPGAQNRCFFNRFY